MNNLIDKTKNPLVTMTMDISYRFHPHLIGRNGKHIEQIRNKTKTEIHVSCRKLTTSGESNSDIVAIVGELENLVSVIDVIRTDQPVEIILDCKPKKSASFQDYLSKYFGMKYGVVLRFFPTFDGGFNVKIRGQQNQIDSLIKAVLHLSSVTQTQVESRTFQIQIDTSFDHVWFVRNHTEKIASITGAIIRTTDIFKINEFPKKYRIWIYSSSLNAVYETYRMINGLLPLKLMVNIESDDISSSIKKKAQESDILLSLENSNCTKYITVLSYEWNAENLFKILRLCLNLNKNYTKTPNLQSVWIQLRDVTGNKFVSCAEELLKTFSPSKLEELSSMFTTIRLEFTSLKNQSLTIENISLDLPGRSSNSSCSDEEICKTKGVPASLTALGFDPNSFRILSSILETVNLSHYSEKMAMLLYSRFGVLAELFLYNEVDLALFSTLTEKDLLSLGITSFGARKIMINIIKELKL